MSDKCPPSKLEVQRRQLGGAQAEINRLRSALYLAEAKVNLQQPVINAALHYLKVDDESYDMDKLNEAKVGVRKATAEYKSKALAELGEPQR